MEKNNCTKSIIKPEGKNIDPKSSKDQDMPLKCKKCDFKCALNVDLETNVIDLHQDRDNLAFCCTKCDYKIDAYDSLVTHMETHKGDIDSFTCTECEYTAKTEHSLKLHMAIHTGENEKFICIYCEHEFPLLASLLKHIVTHKVDNKGNVSNDIEEVKYECNECEYKATTEDNLRLHMLTHTGEIESFACNLCKYQCTSHDMYKKHMDTHKGEITDLRKNEISNVRKDSISSPTVWDKLSLDVLARKHFIDSLQNNDGFSAPFRNGKPIKARDLQKSLNNDNRNKNRRNSGVVGTSKSSNLTVSQRKYRGTVFATRYMPNIELSTDKADLEKNLKTKTGEEHHVDVEKLATRYDSYSSFKITCICSNTAALMNSEIWPEGS